MDALMTRKSEVSVPDNQMCECVWMEAAEQSLDPAAPVCRLRGGSAREFKAKPGLSDSLR